MPVEDVARTDVVTTRGEQSAGNLATVMTTEGVGSVVVVDEADRPVGIVTDRDLVVAVLEPRLDPTEVTASDMMTEALVTVETGNGILDATSTMSEHGVRRLPVVAADGTLDGVLTLDDLTRLFATELDDLAVVIEAESPAY